MRALVLCAGALLAPTLSYADYIQLSRQAVLRAKADTTSASVEQLKPAAQLALLEGAQVNGYYHVRDGTTGMTGWVYRTFGRRYSGDLTATAVATAPATAAPVAADFAVPAAPNWGNATKSSGCQSVDGLPDAGCTPGDIQNPQGDEKTERQLICSADFTTKTVRDKTTTPAQKANVYPMYSTPHPAHNTGSTQMCEIDHLVALELGGADTMANVWPQCTDGYAGWHGPGFRDKDGFENYLWYHVCVNQDIGLREAQTEIATNWKKYWELAGKPDCRQRQSCE